MVRRGVGIIGAGPGASALHAPTLGGLADHFAVVHVSDGGGGRAAMIASRFGARYSVGIDDLLADPDVEVVAICSPPSQHAQHVLAAVVAGKRAIFCEKPLALTGVDAIAVIDACRDSGATLIVGTNHFFDPAWKRAKHHLLSHGGPVRSVGVTIALPPNGRYHEVVGGAAPSAAPSAPSARPAPDWTNPAVASAVVRELVLGLGVHDLPALRDLAPVFEEVVFARPVTPIGYIIGLAAGDVLVQLIAVMLPGGPDALWRLSIGTSFDEIEVEFPPAFVHSGGTTVTVRAGNGTVTRYPSMPDDGYIEEWRALADALDLGLPAEYGELLDDALYAIRIADAAADAVVASMASTSAGTAVAR